MATYQHNARQSTAPNQFPRTARPITVRVPGSFDPGKEVPVIIEPVLREEAVRGQVAVAVQMAEMPKPLLNSVSMRTRVWFVPYTAFERFPSLEAFYAAWAEEPEREGMDLVPALVTGTIPETSEIAIASGLQYDPADVVNIDFVEAYNQVINHERRNVSAVLADETMRDLDDHSLARAIFINHLFSDVKPTFDEASVEGLIPIQLDGGDLPIQAQGGGEMSLDSRGKWSGATTAYVDNDPADSESRWRLGDVNRGFLSIEGVQADTEYPIVAKMNAALAQIKIAEIDRGRVLAQLARIRDRFAGHEEVRHIDALMEGFHIPFEDMKRPILLNEQVTAFQTVERHATDGPSLDQSVTVGVAMSTLSVTLPANVTGGYLVVTAAAMPDQIFERRRDWMLYTTSVDQYPNALRDTLDIHKVEIVKCADVDLQHATPDATYGYAPLNMRFARPKDRVGGKFRDKPENAENRAQLWLIEQDDPVYGQSHLLCPHPFPKDVFADTNAHAFETRSTLAAIGTGITVMGPAVLEDQGSYAALVDYASDDDDA